MVKQTLTGWVDPHPVDGSCGVDEDCVPIATLLAEVQNPERLQYTQV